MGDSENLIMQIYRNEELIDPVCASATGLAMMAVSVLVRKRPFGTCPVLGGGASIFAIGSVMFGRYFSPSVMEATNAPLIEVKALNRQLNRNEALTAAFVSTTGLAMMAVSSLLLKRPYRDCSVHGAGTILLMFSTIMFAKATSPLEDMNVPLAE